jgi:hypothetical protein
MKLIIGVIVFTLLQYGIVLGFIALIRIETILFYQYKVNPTPWFHFEEYIGYVELLTLVVFVFVGIVYIFTGKRKSDDYNNVMLPTPEDPNSYNIISIITKITFFSCVLTALSGVVALFIKWQILP